MVCPLAGFFVMATRLVAVPATALVFPKVDALFH